MPTATTTWPLTAEGVTGALGALGATPDQVADTLTRLGHRGHRGCPRRCPVALYLLAEFPDATDIDVDTDMAELFTITAPTGTRPVAYPVAYAGADLPEPVQQFVRRFDETGIVDRHHFVGWYDHLDTTLTAPEGLPA